MDKHNSTSVERLAMHQHKSQVKLMLLSQGSDPRMVDRYLDDMVEYEDDVLMRSTTMEERLTDFEVYCSVVS